MEDNSLFNSSLVIGMHDDLEIIDEVEVGFNDNLELVVRIERTHYGFTAEDLDETKCWIDACIPREEAFKVSRKLRVPLNKLPFKLAQSAESFGEWEMHVTPQMCWETFHELLALLEGNGAKPTLRNHPCVRYDGTPYLPWR